MPWAMGRVMAFGFEILASLPFVTPFLTRDQLTLLQDDNVVDPDSKGLADLGIQSETIEAIVPKYLARHRRYGQFHKEQEAG